MKAKKKKRSVKKVMASLFWDSKSLKELKGHIQEKRPCKIRDGVLLLHDNASTHTARVSVAMASKCR